MNGRSCISALLLGFIAFISGCNAEQGTNPEQVESYTFRYLEQGGIAGVSNELVITSDDSLKFTGQNLRVMRQIEASEQQEIFALLSDHHFFRLDSTFVPGQVVMDDVTFILSYESDSVQKKVVASGYCSGTHGNCTWPEDLKIIVSALQNKVTELSENATSGCVSIYREYEATPWPYTSEIILADTLNREFEVRDEIYRTVRAANDAEPQQLFYSDDWVYYITASIRLNTPENDYDTTLHVHDRAQPNFWTFDPSLDEIGDSKVKVSGAEYTWLDSLFDNGHYPWYFMDGNLTEGESIYQLDFIRGNACQ